MMYSFLAGDWQTNRELFRRKPAVVETIDPPRPLNFVLIHGWHSLYGPLLPLENRLRQLPGADGVRFFRVTYDTHWKPFTQSARDIIAQLRGQGARPENTILFGYSMGGLVCRALVADGFTARYVFCSASPHLGPAPWMPSGDIGSLSIAPWSARLTRLNANARDRAHRGNYMFVGFDFRDRTGYQGHDRIVTLRSALGEGVEGVGTHHTVSLRYQGLAPGCDPHLRGMDPDYLGPVLEQAERLFAAA